MNTIEMEKKDKKEKEQGGTWPIILFMAGMVVLMILLKLAINYFKH